VHPTPEARERAVARMQIMNQAKTDEGAATDSLQKSLQPDRTKNVLSA
jgi:hypothetical protein